MSKRSAKPAVPVQEKPAAAESLPTEIAVPWRIAFVVLGLLLITLSWFPLTRINAHIDGGTNEGFSSYYEQKTVDGHGLYAEPPTLYATNYPPFGFHLIGVLSRIVNAGVNSTGRWVSLFAFFGIAWIIAQIVLQFSHQRRYAFYASLCWIVWIAAFDMNRMAFNDPHVLAILFNLSAFYLYVRRPESTRFLIASAALFAISLFTKQTLVILPAAVALDLFLRSRKRFAIWFGAAVGSCVLLLLVTFALDGRYLFQHLLIPREYSVSDMWSNTLMYLTFVQIPLVAALFWTLGGRRAGLERILGWAFLVATAFGIYLVGGNGAGVNHFYDSMIMTIIICGLVAAAFEKYALRTRYPTAVLTALLILPFFATSLLSVPRRVPYDILRSQSISGLEREYGNAVDFVRQRPGPALCESLLVCFEAGKQEIYDAFVVDQAIRTGHLDEAKVADLVTTRHYSSIVLSFNPAEAIRPVARQRFSQKVMDALFQQYRPAYRDSRYVIFVPR